MRTCYTCGLVEGVSHAYAPWGYHEGQKCEYGDESAHYEHTWLVSGPPGGAVLELLTWCLLADGPYHQSYVELAATLLVSLRLAR